MYAMMDFTISRQATSNINFVKQKKYIIFHKSFYKLMRDIRIQGKQ